MHTPDFGIGNETKMIVLDEANEGEATESKAESKVCPLRLLLIAHGDVAHPPCMYSAHPTFQPSSFRSLSLTRQSKCFRNHTR